MKCIQKEDEIIYNLDCMQCCDSFADVASSSKKQTTNVKQDLQLVLKKFQEWLFSTCHIVSEVSSILISNGSILGIPSASLLVTDSFKPPIVPFVSLSPIESLHLQLLLLPLPSLMFLVSFKPFPKPTLVSNFLML